MTETFGEAVRRQRLAKGLGVRELARALGLSAPYISDIEHDRRTPSEIVLRALAHVLGADADALMALSGRLEDETVDYLRRTPAARELVRLLATQRASNGQVRSLVVKVRKRGQGVG
jgi:transcriptional regulator with XRE-family HTH domain